MESTTAIDDAGDYHTCSENSAEVDDSEHGSFISLDSESGFNIDTSLSYDQRRMNCSHDTIESIDTVPAPVNIVSMAPETVEYRHQIGVEDMAEIDDTVAEHDRDPPESFLFLFLLISFGYMLPWTSLGSLISYYKATYSASFYVKLYCAYYMPGLPIALLQYRYDTYMDSIFSSRWTYLFRGLTAYLIMMGVLVSLIFFRSENILIILFSLLGLCAWLCHGTASILASMYPRSAIVNLQTGVRCPELVTVVIVSALNLGKTATRGNLSIFYIVNCALIAVSAVSWIIVIMSGTSKHYFSIQDDIPAVGDSEGSSLYETLVPKNRNGKVSKETFLEEKYDSPGKKGGNVVSEECRIFIMNDGSKSTDEIVKAHMSSREKERQRILPLRLALFVITFFSIFQASFFAYVTSSVKHRDIEQILYFVRLFSDLLGRPLTRVLRFSFLKTNRQLLMAALFRVFFVILFFLYILFPVIPRSDIFVIGIVAAFSISSGYLIVLVYEYASNDCDKLNQAAAIGLLNISFQGASFCAVLISLGVTSSAWFNNLS